jgi:hypothetical protein
MNRVGGVLAPNFGPLDLSLIQTEVKQSQKIGASLDQMKMFPKMEMPSPPKLEHTTEASF